MRTRGEPVLNFALSRARLRRFCTRRFRIQQDRRHTDQNQNRHGGIDHGPGHNTGEIERPRARNQHAHPIAEYDRRRARGELAFLKYLDPIGIDNDVLTCRCKRHPERQDCRQADV